MRAIGRRVLALPAAWTLLAACLLLAGCGPAGEEGGRASLWITRDRGATVLYEGEVAAGQTVLQALRSVAEVETRYGGRFVQAIDGLAGGGGRDWLYYVNGVAANRSAADYRLRAGEIAWWDYHRWRGRPQLEVVVGAFPEPFLHGYDGVVRPAAVRYEKPTQRRAAEALGRLVAAGSVAPARVAPPRGANLLRVSGGSFSLRASAAGPTGPFTFVLTGRPAELLALARRPERVRFHFEVPPR